MRTADQSRIDEFRAKDAQLVQIVDAALADATRRAGDHLVCRPGCTQCCHGTFAINALDAARLRSAMADLAATDPEQASKIQSRAQLFLDEYRETFPGDPHSGILAPTPEALEAFDEYANEVPCPALNPESGFCDLYEARPVACRVFGPPVRIIPDPVEDQAENLESNSEQAPTLAVCELCFTGASPEEIEANEMFVPRDAEDRLLEELKSDPYSSENPCETIVAFCLLPTGLI